MKKNFFEAFKHYEGQPVRIFTDDGRIHTGIILDAFEDYVEIIEACGRLFLISLCHIDAIEEPQMELRCCPRDKDKDKEDSCG